jgi:large subunit ribosomal protein L18
MISRDKITPRQNRKERIRRTLSGSGERPRLSVYRSLKHIYAQVVDDTAGKTVAFASDLSPELRGEKLAKKEKARRVGKLIAEKLLAQKIDKVVFDRNGYIFHGRVAAVAQAAREAGLKF